MLARTQARVEKAQAAARLAAAAAAGPPADRRGAGVLALDESPFLPGCDAELARSAERARAALLEEGACAGPDRDDAALGGAFARGGGRRAQAPLRPGLGGRPSEVWLGPAREDAGRPLLR